MISFLRLVSRIARDSWLIFGIVLLLFVVSESGLCLFDRVRLHLAPNNDEMFISADTYVDKSWLKGYLEEFEQSNVSRWEPYTGWRRRPYSGRYINIDNDGIRRTVISKDKASSSENEVKILIFGGSTVWGTGARDEFTIPSILAAKLGEKYSGIRVTNLGESGYVSTQESVLLTLLLQKNIRPDFVIFYDGINDIFSSFQQNKVGLPQNDYNRAKEFNFLGPQRQRERQLYVIQEIFSESKIINVLRKIFNHSIQLPNTTGGTELIKEVSDRYLSNMELVKKLGVAYGFRPIFYLQPTIFEKNSLTPYEAKELDKVKYLREYFGDAYNLIRRDAVSSPVEDNFQDVSKIFSDVREPIFIDWSHIGEIGNEIIAHQMYKNIVAIESLKSM